MSIKVTKNYVGGEWCAATGSERLDVVNPATGEKIGETVFSSAADVERAVKAAKEAFWEWRTTPPLTRARYLFKFKQILEDRFEECARVCTMEVGKTLDESRGEVRRAIEVVEVMTGITSLMKGETLEDIAADIDCVVFRQPIGVFAAVCPFNFPFMVPLWFLPPAIASGNTFIVKPSELVPLSQQLVFEMLDELNLPPGVVNLVNGGKETVEAILHNPDIAGVSFVGSTQTARFIYSECAKYGKRVQALGGAKNFIIVMPDANIQATVAALIGSCFGCAGQRCLAGSNVIAVGEVHDKLVDAFVERAKAVKVGNGLEPATQMGPVVSKKALERILYYIELGVKEGAKLVLDGRNVKVDDYPNGFYIGPTIFDNVSPEMKIAQEEIFGPVVGIIRADDFDHAMEIINGSPYANASSIFTCNGKWAREFAYRVPALMCGINIGIAAPMAFFPFGGARQSFFGDIKAHGKESIDFYTDKKVLTIRWF